MRTPMADFSNLLNLASALNSNPRPVMLPGPSLTYVGGNTHSAEDLDDAMSTVRCDYPHAWMRLEGGKILIFASRTSKKHIATIEEAQA